MATKRLVPTSTVANNWTNGDHTDIDETIAGADDGTTVWEEGTSASPVADGGYIEVGFNDGEFVDSDTITNVSVEYREQCDLNSSGSKLRVNLYTNGSFQGGVVTNCAASWTTRSVNETNWNQDFSASQMDGLTVRIETTQTGMPSDDHWEITALELVVTYTPAPAGFAHAWGQVIGSLAGLWGGLLCTLNFTSKERLAS